MSDKEGTGARPRLAGRRVLITGAASGIGRATAQLAALGGAKLALLDVNETALKSAAEATGGVALAINLADAESAPAVVDRAAETLGGLDGVVNCAGVYHQATLPNLALEDWRRVLAVNLTGPYVVCRAALRHLAEGSSIVNVASGMGVRPDAARFAAYAASKGGLIAFTKALSSELAPGIRVNAVAPGLTRTPMTEFLFDGETSTTSARYPMGRPADPAEIAQAIVFLLSDEASYITGVTLAADGGRTLH